MLDAVKRLDVHEYHWKFEPHECSNALELKVANVHSTITLTFQNSKISFVTYVRVLVIIYSTINSPFREFFKNSLTRIITENQGNTYLE